MFASGNTLIILLRFSPGTGISFKLTSERYKSNAATKDTSRMCSEGSRKFAIDYNHSYWNWILDWEDITQAPVWHEKDGFGTNGDPSVGEAIMGGHCVVDGPFARLEVPYIDKRPKPHCLSRGFESGGQLAKHGSWFRPEAMEKLQRGNDYNAFNLGLEDGPHIAIPRSIRGDFSMFTAPYDPVFFLHHTQLDRLWWTWQQRDPQNRKWQYRGLAAHNFTDPASLTDVIPMGGLAPDIKVAEIIDTESDLLCYIY
ncbi:Uncharacterised domain, di-copper centre [Lasallia pustulata]|uniref:Uncharacterized domain, di-copper centre n=1 Tax=Lasallia pustulata TaxID=136370 RepID=A0A1W5DB43_9LECA|nr:Uncharacterised domain, di-copper centre [Lasallia pustulata]